MSRSVRTPSEAARRLGHEHGIAGAGAPDRSEAIQERRARLDRDRGVAADDLEAFVEQGRDAGGNAALGLVFDRRPFDHEPKCIQNARSARSLRDRWQRTVPGSGWSLPHLPNRSLIAALRSNATRRSADDRSTQ